MASKKTKKHLENEIEVLKIENKQLRHKLQLLETRLGVSERRCACYHNNQKTYLKDEPHEDYQVTSYGEQ